MWVVFSITVVLFVSQWTVIGAKKCSCVTASGLNVRAAPGVGSTKLLVLNNGDCPFYLGQQRTVGSLTWIKVQTDSQIGWVAEKYTTLKSCPDTVKATAGNASWWELRGVWIATVSNIDWPRRPGQDSAMQQNDLIQLLDLLQAHRFNALYFQVRPAGDALYNSSVEPWSRYLTGTQGKSPVPFWDPLEFVVTEAHKRNIEVHAWLNPYRAKVGSGSSGLSANHMARKFFQYAYNYGSYVWMDPGSKEVQSHTEDVIVDIIRRYDVDGIHFDDYFYPYPVSGLDFPDAKTYGIYTSAGGTMTLADWRRANVDNFVKRLENLIHKERSWVKFSISPFGIWRPGNPTGIKGFDQYNQIYADPKLWLQQGWVDALIPQLYWKIDPPAQSYPNLLQWWLKQNPKGRHVYAGNYLSRLTVSDWPMSEIQRQVQLTRDKNGEGSLGNVMFSIKPLRDDVKSCRATFRNKLYTSAALPPPITWLKDDCYPKAPINLKYFLRTLHWSHGSANMCGRYYAIWSVDSAGKKTSLLKILTAQTTSTDIVFKEGIAMSAVSRLGRESALAYMA